MCPPLSVPQIDQATNCHIYVGWSHASSLAVNSDSVSSCETAHTLLPRDGTSHNRLDCLTSVNTVLIPTDMPTDQSYRAASPTEVLGPSCVKLTTSISHRILCWPLHTQNRPWENLWLYLKPTSGTQHTSPSQDSELRMVHAVHEVLSSRETFMGSKNKYLAVFGPLFSLSHGVPLWCHPLLLSLIIHMWDELVKLLHINSTRCQRP